MVLFGLTEVWMVGRLGARELSGVALGDFVNVDWFLVHGLQIVGAGLLRGVGTPRPAVAFNLVGLYVLALPIGYALARFTVLELRGIWIGLCIGLAFVAACFVAWIAYRGPARLERLAIDS